MIKFTYKRKIKTFFKMDFLKNIKEFFMNNENKNDKIYNILKSVILVNGGTENSEICSILEDLYANETNISVLNSIVLNNKEDNYDKL
jgi:NAD(P)H-flavin reductase